ncbi:MAG: hypothetical protein AAGI45_18040 [Cyanobacteria bacterium P01_H01_bin.26]
MLRPSGAIIFLFPKNAEYQRASFLPGRSRSLNRLPYRISLLFLLRRLPVHLATRLKSPQGRR